MKPISEIDDPRLVKALAHPLRVRILRVLEGRTASPNEIATELEAPLPNVSYHVRALARAGLAELVRTTPRRGAVEHYYRAVGRVRVTNRAWADVPSIVKAGLVDSALSQIGETVTAAAVDGGFERSDVVLARRPLTLDEEGFSTLSREAAAFIDRAREIAEESERRLSATAPAEGQEIPGCVAVMVFEAPTTSQTREPPAERRGRRLRSS
jgi:DNA-binding transcriptional ArsR family regulator